MTTTEAADEAPSTDQSDDVARLHSTQSSGETPPPVHQSRQLLLLAFLPLVGYAVLFPYAAVLYGVMGPDSHPLLLLGIPEILLGGAYVYCLERDQRSLRRADVSWEAARWLWYPVAFIAGATVLCGPLVPILYFERRRRRVGYPTHRWTKIVRTRELG